MGRYELDQQEITVKGGAQQWADRRWDFAMSPQLPPLHRSHTERATHERYVREVLAARAEQRLTVCEQQYRDAEAAESFPNYWGRDAK